MRKPGRASEIPPPLELDCLRALWRIGEGSVKDVRGVITENRNLAYTTVMTVLERLTPDAYRIARTQWEAWRRADASGRPSP